MKKVLSLVLVLSLFANMSIGVSAFSEAENYVPITQITREELVNCALNLAREIVPGVKLTIGDNIIPLYDQTESLVGFSLEYFHEEIPYGFLNLDFRKENPIVDFSISEGCPGIYDSIISIVNHDEDIAATLKSDKSLDKQNTFAKKLYIMGAGAYGVSTPNSTTIYTPINAHKIVNATISENNTRSVASVNYNDREDIYSDNYTGTVVTAPVYIDQYNSIDSIISQAYIEHVTNRYACTVLALTEIASQEGILYNNSIADTFLELWDYTDTYDFPYDDPNSNIQYGTTNMSNARSGMISYVNARGHSCSANRTDHPAFGYFKDMVDANRSGMLSYGITVNSTPEQHVISVFGYCVTRVGGTLANYLIVADGWYFSPRFLCYSDTDFSGGTIGLSFLIV